MPRDVAEFQACPRVQVPQRDDPADVALRGVEGVGTAAVRAAWRFGEDRSGGAEAEAVHPRDAEHAARLYVTTPHHTVLYHTTLYCNLLYYNMIYYNLIWYNLIVYYVVWPRPAAAPGWGRGRLPGPTAGGAALFSYFNILFALIMFLFSFLLFLSFFFLKNLSMILLFLIVIDIFISVDIYSVCFGGAASPSAPARRRRARARPIIMDCHHYHD